MNSRFPSIARFLLVLIVGVPSCGYRSLNSPAGAAALHVVLVKSRLGDPLIASEVVFGVREGLARRGALVGGEGYPRVEVEVERSDFVSEGIALPQGSNVPLARGTDVGITGRAWVVESEGAPRDRDTGDMRAFEVEANRSEPVSESRRDVDAGRRAARSLGADLAARILLEPVLYDAPVER